MPKGNPKPKITKAFLDQQKPKHGDQPLATPIPIRFSQDVDAILRQIGDRQQYVRQAVEEKLRADGLL